MSPKSKGFLPGDSTEERVAPLSRPEVARAHCRDRPPGQRRFLVKAVDTVRARLGGKATYRSAAESTCVRSPGGLRRSRPPSSARCRPERPTPAASRTSLGTRNTGSRRVPARSAATGRSTGPGCARRFSSAASCWTRPARVSRSGKAGHAPVFSAAAISGVCMSHLTIRPGSAGIDRAPGGPRSTGS